MEKVRFRHNVLLVRFFASVSSTSSNTPYSTRRTLLVCAACVYALGIQAGSRLILRRLRNLFKRNLAERAIRFRDAERRSRTREIPQCYAVVGFEVDLFYWNQEARLTEFVVYPEFGYNGFLYANGFALVCTVRRLR